MPGLTISPPGVEVIQEFVTTSPTVAQPALPSVLVGACFQIVDAFDDTGEPQAEALAGTYRDAQGRIAYTLPTLRDQAVLTGFESDIRTFLVYGDTTRELNSVYDEVVVVDNSTGTYTLIGSTFSDPDGLFQQVGIEAGDVVRLTYRGETIDIPVVSVTSDTILVLGSGYVTENVASVTYDLVKNPAEFVFDVTQQATWRWGDAADFVLFSATALKTDGVTVGDYVGSLGDTLHVTITDSEHFVDGTDGAIGDAIFTSAGATFTTSVGAVGNVTDRLIFLGAPGAGRVMREILQVVSATRLVMETGATVGLAAQTYRVGTLLASGTNGVTNGGGTTLTSVGATFLTTIPNTAGTPDDPTYVEIGTDGVYEVTTVDSNTQLTLGTAATGALTAQAYTVMAQTATNTDGATGALTDFVSVASDFTTLTSPTTKSVNVGGTVARAISSVTDGDRLVMASGFASSGDSLAFSVVETTATLSLTYDGPNDTVIIRMERTAGLTGSTYAEIVDALTDELDPAYNSLVSDHLTASLGGTTGTGAVTITEAILPIDANLDGGSDDENLLLDADLLQSATPTASVYVSYKALRVDVSDQATSPALIELSSQTQRESLLGVASEDNPLSLAAFFALQNSPTRSLKVLGVSEVSATKPNGTLEAYTSALEFLSGYDVYHIATLTMDPAVGAALDAHVTALSASDQKSERVGIFSTPMPAFENAAVVASGTDGNTGAGFDNNAAAEFMASTDFEAAGVLAGDVLVVTSLATSTDSPISVDGTVGPLYGLTITSVSPSDPFVLLLNTTGAGISTGWNSLVDVSFTVYRDGAAITQAVDQAEVISSVGEGYANRRMVHHWPDEGTADVDGTASVLDGFYMAASWAGKMNVAPPQQPFSRTTISGWTSVRHSNGYFSKAHLDRIAGGGTWISIQESQNAPLRCRHQLTTDVSSIERREFSITRIVDYVAKFLRSGVNKQVGNFNITQSYLDGLASTIQGLMRALIESGVITAGDLVSIAQNATTPDKVDVVVAIDVPYPANTIEITIQV